MTVAAWGTPLAAPAGRAAILPAMHRLIVLATAAVLACGGKMDPDAPLSTHRNEERDVTFVTAEDLHDWMEAGHENEVVFIDNRNLFTFEQQRIAGARLIPTDDVELALGSLPLNKWAVFYCT